MPALRAFPCVSQQACWSVLTGTGSWCYSCCRWVNIMVGGCCPARSVTGEHESMGSPLVLQSKGLVFVLFCLSWYSKDLCSASHDSCSLLISLFFRVSGGSDSSQPCGLFQGVHLLCVCVCVLVGGWCYFAWLHLQGCCQESRLFICPH